MKCCVCKKQFTGLAKVLWTPTNRPFCAVHSVDVTDAGLELPSDLAAGLREHLKE